MLISGQQVAWTLAAWQLAGQCRYLLYALKAAVACRGLHRALYHHGGTQASAGCAVIWNRPWLAGKYHAGVPET